MNYRTILAFLIAVILSSCNEKPADQNKQSSSTSEEPKSVSDSIVEHGYRIISKTQQTLSSNLQTALKDSGVAYAVQFCNINASSITQEIQDSEQVEIRRISHKPRNPANAASDEERSILTNYLNLAKTGEVMEPLIEETPKRITMYSPITVFSPLCLKCHGMPDQDIAAEDYIIINMLYPQDKAVGFGLNDFRGMWKLSWNKEKVNL